MKAAVLDARVFDAHDEKVVSFFCLFRDGLPARSVMLAKGDVDRGGLGVAALGKRGVVGGRPDGFLDAIARFLLLLFAAALGPVRQRQDRDRDAAGSAQQSRETRRKLAVRTLVDGEQQAFEIRNEAPRLMLLPLEPLLLRLAQRDPPPPPLRLAPGAAPQGPARHRRAHPWTVRSWRRPPRSSRVRSCRKRVRRPRAGSVRRTRRR